MRKKLNWIERRTLGVLLPYQYNEGINVTDNSKLEYVIKSASIFDYIIIPIGLWMLRKHNKDV